VKQVLQTPRIEVKAGLDQVLQNSAITGTPAEWLRFRKLLSSLLGSGSAVPPTKKKAPRQQKHKNARFICNCSHPQRR